MMAKMRLEEKQMANKFRKEKGLPELDETEKAAPTFTRQRRGRDDRKDGARGQRGGRGRGRGAMPPPGPVPIPPQMMGGMGGMGQMGGMGPFVPGDFRTPPFPGLEGEFRKKRFKKTSVFTNPLSLFKKPPTGAVFSYLALLGENPLGGVQPPFSSPPPLFHCLKTSATENVK